MNCVVIAAAGASRRMGKGKNKVLLDLDGQPIVKTTAEKFIKHPDIDKVIVVCSKKDLEEMQRILGDNVDFVIGGDSRGESVYNGLKSVEGKFEKVLIHDGARPYVSEKTISDALKNVRHSVGTVAGVKTIDTIKRCDESGRIIETPDRNYLFNAQTPQGFLLDEIIDAYENVGFELTDDAAVFEKNGGTTVITESDYKNKKITVEADLDNYVYLTGFGLDVHQLAENRKLVLGGVEIPHALGLLGHSDADVLLHAICDALLGAAGMGDIGKHFPDTDEQYKGISSMILLKHVYELLKQNGYEPINVSAVVCAQKPKLASYIPQMNKNIADALNLPVKRVNVAATTTEKLGFEGEEKGISARATVMVVSRNG